MARTRSAGPRPNGFFRDWRVFASEALSEIVRREGGRGDVLATTLLAGGALLGSAAVAAVVQANQPAIDRKGKEWGVPHLSALVVGTGGLIGALAGGMGGAMVSRLLGRYTTDKAVRALEDRLAGARREYAELRQARAAGLLDEPGHRDAVELLFARLVADVAPG